MSHMLAIEHYGYTSHALVLRAGGAIHVLFIAAEVLPAAEQYQACENDGPARASMEDDR